MTICHTCPDCKGEGSFEYDGWNYSSDSHYNFSEDCDRCEGRGHLGEAGADEVLDAIEAALRQSEDQSAVGKSVVDFIRAALGERIAPEEDFPSKKV